MNRLNLNASLYVSSFASPLLRGYYSCLSMYNIFSEAKQLGRTVRTLLQPQCKGMRDTSFHNDEWQLLTSANGLYEYKHY